MAKKNLPKDLLPESDSSGEELSERDTKTSKTLQNDLEDDFNLDDDDEQAVFQTRKKTQTDRFDASDDDESENSEDEEEEAPKKLDETSAMVHEEKTRSKKLKKLTPEQLAKEQKKIKKTGVCYLSSIPPYMKPVKVRSVLARFGKLDRIFLKPEDPSSYKKRVKYGGNKKKKYTEGWVEFVNKKDAKLCAETMNGNILGGKKLSYYHDDMINIKYLSGFKWFDLTQQIAKENEIRTAKLTLEISQQLKLNKSFVNNVERSKYVARKRKAEESPAEPMIKRTFDQRDIASTRADAKQEFKKAKNSENLENVLSQVF